MQQHSKHLSEFNPNQILQIVKWGREKLNLSATVIEQETSRILFEQMEGGKAWLTGVIVNGNIVKPLNK